MDDWKLKMFSAYAKSKLALGIDETAGGIAPYVRMYLFAASGITAILGVVALILTYWIAGIATLIAASFVAASEATFLVKPIEKFLDFYLENYLWRVFCYGVISILTFFSLVTFCGGLLIILGAAGYLYCWFMGEKPKIGVTEMDAQYNPEKTDQTSDLLSNYSQV